MNHGEIVSFFWGVADLIRDTFKRGKYQDVILPLTVLRRLDCVLGRTKEKVLARQAELRGKGLQDPDAQLRRASGFAFYNTSRYDFEKLLGDAPHLAANLRNYIAGFSPNMREVLEKFDFDNTSGKLDEAGLLFPRMSSLLAARFASVTSRRPRLDAFFSRVPTAPRGELRCGNTRGALTCEYISSIPVALPPTEEQLQISNVIDTTDANVRALSTQVTAAIDRLKELRTALISAAVTGKIDVRGA